MSDNRLSTVKQSDGPFRLPRCDEEGRQEVIVVQGESSATSGYTTSVTITRPNNTTAYTAGDAIGQASGSAILEFANMASDAKDVIITSIELEIDESSKPSGMDSFYVRLYNAAPTAIADNAAWDLVAGDRSKYLGKILLTSPTDEGSTLYSDNDGINKHIKLASTSLFVVLQTSTAFTPSASTVKKLTIHTIEL